MTDVRLTATNPEDSSVVPVACNAKGELLLEEPQVVEGPQGPQGPPGDKGDPGDPFTGNFAGDVSFGGEATFAKDATINGVIVGRGAVSIDTNTAVGRNALTKTTTGFNNTAVGRNALFSSTTGDSNTAVGLAALYSKTTGSDNTAVGVNALNKTTDGNDNTAVGAGALITNTEGSNNTAFGRSAGYQLLGSNNTFIGNHQGAADLSNTLSLSTGATERMRISSDDAVDFNQKCGFTPDGGLWITDSRGHKYRTTFASNDLMQWEAYTVQRRNEPQFSAKELEALAEEQQPD